MPKRLQIDPLLLLGRIGKRGREIDCTCFCHISASGFVCKGPEMAGFALFLPAWAGIVVVDVVIVVVVIVNVVIVVVIDDVT